MRKLILISVIVAGFNTVMFGQQLPQLSLHSFDPLVINPAVAGSNSYPEIKLHHRSQWVGFKGSPRTSLLSYHVALTPKTGLGVFLANDAPAVNKRTSLNVSYAYHIPMKSFWLGLGLNGSLMQYTLDAGDVDIPVDSDPSITEGMKDNAIKPDFAFGMYAYNQKFYLGISSQQLLSMKTKFNFSDGTQAIIPLTNHFYFTGAYNFELEKKYNIEPSFLVQSVKGAPMMIDLNAKMTYKNSIITGLSYRVGDSFLMILGYRFKRYFIAYSYDLVVSGLRKTNSGSHEIILAYHWPVSSETKPLFDLKGTFRGQIKKRIYG